MVRAGGSELRSSSCPRQKGDPTALLLPTPWWRLSTRARRTVQLVPTVASQCETGVLSVEKGGQQRVGVDGGYGLKIGCAWWRATEALLRRNLKSHGAKSRPTVAPRIMRFQSNLLALNGLSERKQNLNQASGARTSSTGQLEVCEIVAPLNDIGSPSDVWM